MHTYRLLQYNSPLLFIFIDINQSLTNQNEICVTGSKNIDGTIITVKKNQYITKTRLCKFYTPSFENNQTHGMVHIKRGS